MPQTCHLHAGGTREDSQEWCPCKAQIPERLINHRNITLSQCLLRYIHTANGQREKNGENPPSSNAITCYILHVGPRGACLGIWLERAGRPSGTPVALDHATSLQDTVSDLYCSWERYLLSFLLCPPSPSQSLLLVAANFWSDSMLSRLTDLAATVPHHPREEGDGSCCLHTQNPASHCRSVDSPTSQTSEPHPAPCLQLREVRTLLHCGKAITEIPTATGL